MKKKSVPKPPRQIVLHEELGKLYTNSAGDELFLLVYTPIFKADGNFKHDPVQYEYLAFSLLTGNRWNTANQDYKLAIKGLKPYKHTDSANSLILRSTEKIDRLETINKNLVAEINKIKKL